MGGSGVSAPSSMELFVKVAEEATAIPAVLEMTRSPRGYEALFPNWGLRDAKTGHLIDPFDLVDGSDVEMSDWERDLRGCAVGGGEGIKGGRPEPCDHGRAQRRRIGWEVSTS